MTMFCIFYRRPKFVVTLYIAAVADCVDLNVKFRFRSAALHAARETFAINVVGINIAVRAARRGALHPSHVMYKAARQEPETCDGRRSVVDVHRRKVLSTTNRQPSLV